MNSGTVFLGNFIVRTSIAHCDIKFVAATVPKMKAHHTSSFIENPFRTIWVEKLE